VITAGQPVTNLIDAYKFIGGDIFEVVPVPVLIFLVVIILSTILLNNTRFGSNTYAIGGNVMAANVTGIHIARTTIGIYSFAGALYGVAGMVYAGRVLSVNPGAATGYELTAIASSIIGGTSPMGGKGTIWGAVVGALILSVIRNGLTLLAVDAYWQQIAEGLIIVVAVIFAMRKKKN
jgi:inositol transport system permease protein